MSPNLLDSEDLELAVPGTYEPNHNIIHIKKVSPSLNVITSKQRPRKLVIQGQAYLLGAITSIGDNLAFVCTYVCTYVRRYSPSLLAFRLMLYISPLYLLAVF